MQLVFDDRDYLKHQLLLLHSLKLLTILVGGAGSGKSYAVLSLALKQMLTKTDIRTGKSFGLVVYPTLTLALTIFKTKFIMMLNQLHISYTKPKPNLICTPYGDVLILSATDPTTIVGFDATWALWDLADNGNYSKLLTVYLNILQRLRGGGQNCPLAMVGTPLGFKLMYRLAITLINLHPLLVNLRNVIHARTYDNPFVSKKWILRLKKTYSKQLADAYLNGLFVNLARGRAYLSFLRLKHVIKNYTPTQDVVYIGIDFNVDHFSITFALLLPNNTLVFYDLFRGKNFFTTDAVKLIQQKCGNKQVVLYPDTTGKNRATSAVQTDMQILSNGTTTKGKFNIPFFKSNPQHKDRMNVVNVAFDNMQILVDLKCKWLISDFEQVSIDPKTGGIDKTNLLSGMNHMSDAAGYTIYRLLPIDYKRTGGVRFG